MAVVAALSSGGVIVTVCNPAYRTAPAPGGGFATPNILNTADFSTGFDPALAGGSGFFDGAGGAPRNEDPPNASAIFERDNTELPGGVWGVTRGWTTTTTEEEACEFWYRCSTAMDRVWFRLTFKMSGGVTSIMKFWRWYAFGGGAYSMGGWYIKDGNEIISFCFDGLADGARDFRVGIDEADVCDGNVHTLETDYWVNGDPSGFPSAAFWLDGVQVSMPDGPAAPGDPASLAYWEDGRIYGGERAGTLQVRDVQFLSPTNTGNTTTAQITLTDPKISTLGRIGP